MKTNRTLGCCTITVAKILIVILVVPMITCFMGCDPLNSCAVSCGDYLGEYALGTTVHVPSDGGRRPSIKDKDIQSDAVVPPDVEIVVGNPGSGDRSKIIAKVGDKYFYQEWRKEWVRIDGYEFYGRELFYQLEVPEAFTKAISVDAQAAWLTKKDILITGDLANGGTILYYCTTDREEFCFTVKTFMTGFYAGPKRAIFITTDNKLVKYDAGSHYYYIRDIRASETVSLHSSRVTWVEIKVNDRYYDDINTFLSGWESVEIKKRD